MEIKKFRSIRQMNSRPGLPGQYAMVKNQMFMYIDSNKGWRPFNPKGEQIEISQNAYLMAKTVAAQAPLLTAEQIDKSKELISNFITKHNTTKYYMLLVKEISYYTLFVDNSSSNENMSDIVIECLSNLGNIIDINDESEGAIEIWVKDNDGEAHIGYLFPYDQGVIECRLS